MILAEVDEMQSPRGALIDPDKKAKDLTHVEILGIGENILDEREIRFQQEKQRAVAEAQAAVGEKMKRKFEREIARRLEQCKEEHKVEVANLLDNTEERVQEEIAKREAKLQTEMSERLRDLQDKMSREMQDALEELRRKHETELASEVQKTFAQKEAEAEKKLQDAKQSFEEEKIVLKRELEKVCVIKVSEAEKSAEERRLVSLAEQDKKFVAKMAAALQEVKVKHADELEQLRVEISKREDYIAKLFKAIDFLRNSRRELTQLTLDVHEQMKFFIDKTQPFNEGTGIAQFLVPRLDLSRFDAEPDTDPPY